MLSKLQSKPWNITCFPRTKSSLLIHLLFCIFSTERKQLQERRKKSKHQKRTLKETNIFLGSFHYPVVRFTVAKRSIHKDQLQSILNLWRKGELAARGNRRTSNLNTSIDPPCLKMELYIRISEEHNSSATSSMLHNCEEKTWLRHVKHDWTARECIRDPVYISWSMIGWLDWRMCVQ